MAKFEIKQDKNGKFRFNLKASNGQIILSSQAYSSKSACLNGVESVKKNSQMDSRYERKVANNGKHYFVLKASNGQIIGTSQMYSSRTGLEGSVKSTKEPKPTLEKK